MMRKGTKACFMLLVLFLLPTACLKFERAQFPEKQYFMLDVSRQGPPAMGLKQISLRVQGLRISPEFGGRNFVYRTGPMTYESDYYNAFFISPGPMLTRKVSQWLQECGLFQYVSDSSGLIDAPHVLHGEVSSLYGDYSEKKAPKAVLEIGFCIFDESSSGFGIVFKKKYHEAVLVDGKKPGELIAGWNECLKRILTSFEDDLVREWLLKKNELDAAAQFIIPADRVFEVGAKVEL